MIQVTKEFKCYTVLCSSTSFKELKEVKDYLYCPIVNLYILNVN